MMLMISGALFCVHSYAEPNGFIQEQVTGQVIDSQTGEALPGVNILVKGTETGTSTDVNGEYEVTVSSLNGILVFSYVGYQTLEITIEGRATIDVSLQSQALIGEELVVVGYGVQEAEDITGSVSSVSAEEINKVVATNAAQAIQGRVAGVNVSQVGYNPGENATVRIRGTRSITATNDPLYVIDGVPIARGITLNDINPADIESVEVLKDASATAIYGSRGANGVILITTKRSEVGKTTVDYSSSAGVQTPLKEPDVFNAGEYVEYIRESYRNSDTDTYNSSVPSMEEDMNVPLFSQDPYVLESVLMGYDEQGNWNPENVRGFDWMDAVTRTGVLQNHHLSISKGTENASILISGGYYGNKGMVKNMDYKRYNLRANIDYDVSESIHISSSTLVSRVDENIGNNLYGLARSRTPLGRPKDDEGNWIYYIGNDPLMTNTLLDVNGVVNESRQNRILSNLNINVSITDGLSYIGRFGYDYRTARNGEFRSSNSIARLGDDPSAVYGGNSGTDLLAENLLVYETSFKNIHDVDVTLMNSYQENKFETHVISVEGLPYEAQQYYNVGTASDILSVGSNLSEWQMLSWMGRVNYRLFDKYLFTITGRSDGSSRLAPGNKYHFFPSAAIGWRISDEDFLDGVNFINDLKLRVSYGETGNSAIDPYTTQGSLDLTRYVWHESVGIGFEPGEMPNEELTWETTSQVNMGLDFGVLNHRISGSVDVYRADTRDLLMPRVLPVVSGFEGVLDNVGRTRNTGLEIALSTVNTPYNHNFRWSTDFIFSTNKEEIVELVTGKEDDIGNQWFIGQPVDVFFGLDAIGIWQNTQEDMAEMAQFNQVGGHNFEPGLVKIRDVNGDYQINEADRIILGNPRPKWTASISNNMNYKNFDLSFQVYVSYGALGRYAQNLQLNGRFNMTDVNYWTPGNPSNRYPKPNFEWLSPDYIGQTEIEDTSFARLKYVTLGYTLPTSLVNNLGGTRFRVYASAQNPYIYTNYTGPDPEGAQSVETPSPKTFMIGIDLSF